MPDFLPGSNFNDDGECIWCQTNFPNYAPQGIDAFLKAVAGNGKRGKYADCLVGVSGGKDSSYVLLELVTRYKLRVEAFTYDHYGLTDFALNNAKSICRELGVKHHTLSLPHNEHLKSFQTFFSIWTDSNKPIPAAMTCVACKHLHTLGSELAMKRNIPSVVWATCPLEISPFLPLKLKSAKSDNFKRQGMLTSAIQLISEILATPGFAKGVKRHFTTCAIGCLGVTPSSTYLKMRYPSLRQIMFFDYIGWNEKEIVERLEKLTSWHSPADFIYDWHSDCLFNIFKEYMFQKMHGISYTDAFLSNQIRYNLLSRQKALQIVTETKKFYARKIMEALTSVGLTHLSDKIDLSCFEIAEI